MAHKKAGGSKARQGSKVAGKRLGLKIYGGEKVLIGQIIVRQKGTLFHPGEGVKTGRDFTLFAVQEGAVSTRTSRGKKFIDVKKDAG